MKFVSGNINRQVDKQIMFKRMYCPCLGEYAQIVDYNTKADGNAKGLTC